MNAKLRLSLSLLLVLVVLSGCSLFEGRPGTARVVLMLADETPLAGVELALLDGNNEAGKGTTNDQGVVEFTKKPGSYDLVGTVKALTGEIEVAAKITIESGKTTTKTVAVEDLGLLILTIEDKDGVPLSGTEVVIKDSDKEELKTLETAADKVEFLLAPGTYFISAAKDDATAVDKEVVVTAGSVATTVVVDAVATGNVAAGKEYRLLVQSQGYPDPELKKLTDGVVGTTAITDGTWVGSDVGSQIIVLDLGKEYEVISTELVYLIDNVSWVKLPNTISIAVSSDGVEWTLIEEKQYEVPAEDLIVHSETHEISKNARFIAFKAVHTGWLFVGEIQAEAIVSSAKEVDGDLKTIDLNAIFE